MSASVPNASSHAHCSRCDAVCCRLTVVLMPHDDVPEHLTAYTAEGLHVMARDEEGWCVAVDGRHMHCGIYESRPSTCRRFVMDGPCCRAARSDYRSSQLQGIPLTVSN